MKDKAKFSNYVDKILEVFSDLSNAIGIFEELNIGHFDEIQSVQKYDRPDGRKVLVISSKTKGHNPASKKKICVDVVKEGLPTTDQLHSVIYGAGHDSDIRLVVFSSLKDESDDENPTADFNLVKDIVNAKNGVKRKKNFTQILNRNPRFSIANPPFRSPRAIRGSYEAGAARIASGRRPSSASAAILLELVSTANGLLRRSATTGVPQPRRPGRSRGPAGPSGCRVGSVAPTAR